MVQVVMITGCSTGIGRALALEFAARGHRVWATARRPESMADLAGRVAGTVALDVTDAASIASAVARVREAEGRIDILVNNAGFGLMGPMSELAIDDFRKLMETNVTGLLAVTQAVVPAMVARRSGRVVNIGSVSGILVSPFAGAYCASKAAVHALSDAMRLELAPLGIHVVCVQPGGVQSAFSETATAHTAPIAADSPFAPLREAIATRARYSQKKPTPTGQFCRVLCDAVLKDKPPHVVRAGRGAYIYPLAGRLLPALIREPLLRRMFGLRRLGA